MASRSKKKLVICGAAGEVGLNLLAILKEENKIARYEIVAIDINRNNLKILSELFPEVKPVAGDLALKGAWQKEFKGASAVIQLQAQISSPFKLKYARNNIASVNTVLAACKKYKIRNLVHASSSVVISVANDDYTTTKRFGEELVKKSSVPHTILRPTLMYGCFDNKHLGYLSRFFVLPVFPMPGNGKYLRQPLFVEDFCRVILKCAETEPKGKIHNITGKEKIYLINLLKMYAKAMGRKVVFAKIPLPIFYKMIQAYAAVNKGTTVVPEQLTALTAGDVFPIEKWETQFGVKPTSVKQGMEKMAKSRYSKYGSLMTKI